MVSRTTEALPVQKTAGHARRHLLGSQLRRCVYAVRVHAFTPGGRFDSRCRRFYNIERILSLLAVGRRYGAKILEYFASLTGNTKVEEIMQRPHMRELKRTFSGTADQELQVHIYVLLPPGVRVDDTTGPCSRTCDLYFQRDPFSYSSCSDSRHPPKRRLSPSRTGNTSTRTTILDIVPRAGSSFGTPPINSGAFLADVGTMLEIVRKSDRGGSLWARVMIKVLLRS